VFIIKTQKNLSDAKLISFIDRERDTVAWLQHDEQEDVTGSIGNKLQEAMKMTCPVALINGLQPGNCTKAIEGQNIGTIVTGVKYM